MQSTAGILVVPELPTYLTYEIEPLGAGGQSVVYRGYDHQVEQAVAIKFLRRKLVDDPVARERFRREAELMSRVRDRRVPEVYAFVDSATEPCIVMEYLPGTTLSGRIRDQTKGPLTSSECQHIGAELADIMAAIHAAGVMHRDIKPDNVMLGPTDEVSLLDWGIATDQPFHGHRATPSDTVVCDPLTATNGLMGTLPYVAPERLRLVPIGPKADVYGLGATLFCAATGHPPVEAETTQELERKLEFQPPVPLILLRPDLPRRLTRTIDQTLARNPSGRPNLLELEAALLAAA